MVEFVLLVWLVVPGEISEPIEAAVYWDRTRCELARDTLKAQNDESFVAVCVER